MGSSDDTGVEIGDCASAGFSTKSSAKTMVAAAMAKGETLINRSMNGFMLLNLKPPRGKDVGYPSKVAESVLVSLKGAQCPHLHHSTHTNSDIDFARVSAMLSYRRGCLQFRIDTERR